MPEILEVYETCDPAVLCRLRHGMKALSTWGDPELLELNARGEFPRTQRWMAIWRMSEEVRKFYRGCSKSDSKYRRVQAGTDRRYGQLNIEKYCHEAGDIMKFEDI